MPVLNFRLQFKTPDGKAVPGKIAIQRVMLRVPVVVGMHEAAVIACTKSGQTPPSPLSGIGLIDTGATFTSIDESAAASLGLQPTGTRKIGAADGPVEKPQFAFKLEIRGLNMETTDGIGCNLKGQGLIALIGMDLLSHGVLIVNGPDGSFSFAM